MATDHSVTLTWDPPTTRADGTPLMDRAGYKIYYGTSHGDYLEVIDLQDPTATKYTIENLPQGTYYFAVTAYDGVGNESNYSVEGSKPIH